MATNRMNGHDAMQRGKKKRGVDVASIPDRQPPNDLQAELGLVGSVILLPHVLDEVSLIVKPEHFYNSDHRTVFGCMLAMHQAGRKVDPTLLVAKLKEEGDWNGLGGAQGPAGYLSGIINAVPNAAHVAYYAEIVREKFTLREIIRASTMAISEAYDDLPPGDVIGNLNRGISIAECDAAAEPELIADIAGRVIDSLHTPVDTTSRAMTGILSLDQMLGPVMAGEMAVIAARTSLGKTSLAQQILVNSAKNGDPSLLVSLEMSEAELGTRELCRRTGIDSRRIRNGTIGHIAAEELLAAQHGMVGLPFYVWAPPRATASEIRAVARRMHARGGLKVMAIDLIGLVLPDKGKSKGNRHEEIRDISGAIKALAKELRIPIFVLAQLNREADGEEPKLSHLRDSGRIEEDADVVILLHKQRFPPNEGGDAVDAEANANGMQSRILIVAKHRNGQVGSITLGWQPVTTTFSDHSSYQTAATF